MIFAILCTASETILADMDLVDPASAVPQADIGATFIKMMLTFGALIFLLFGTYWFIKRLIRFRLEKGVGNGSIYVVEKKMISPKTILYLVEVDNKKVLLAESHLEIKRLESFENDHNSVPS